MITTATSKIQYSPGGSTTVFTVPFFFLANSHLKVILTTAGVDAVQVLDTDYSVGGAGDENGGQITMTSAPASGTTLTVLRSVPQDQLVDYINNDNFPSETHEQALDKLTMLVQQLTDQFTRVIKLPDAEDEASVTELATKTNRVSTLLGFDANGDLILMALDAGDLELIAPSAVDTADIVNLAVTDGKLAAVLDLSSKTITLPTNFITVDQLVTDQDLINPGGLSGTKDLKLRNPHRQSNVAGARAWNIPAANINSDHLRDYIQLTKLLLNKQYPDLIVSGAGTTAVNGTYEFDSIQDSHGKYIHTSGAYQIITDSDSDIWEIRTNPGGIVMYQTILASAVGGDMDRDTEMWETPDSVMNWEVEGGASPGPTSIVPDIQGQLEVIGDIHATNFVGDGSQLTGIANVNRGVANIVPTQDEGGMRTSFRGLTVSDKNDTLFTSGDDAQKQQGRGPSTSATSDMLLNAQFKLGDEPINDVSDNLSNYTDTIAQIREHYRNRFVLTGAGILYAAGDGAHGQCGQGNTNDCDVFKSVRFGADAASNKKIVSFSVSGSASNDECHVLAIDEDGQVWGFGYNGEGQLGFGDLIDYTSPQKLSTSGASNAATFVAKTATQVLTLGSFHGSSYIIFDDNTIWSTGDNERGQLGLGDTTDRNEFEQLSGITDASRVYGSGDRISSTTRATAYYLATDNKLYGTGDNTDGQLGLGDTTQRDAMTLITSDVGQFASGGQQDSWCVIVDTAGTTAKSFGDNQSGQLGVGDTTDKNTLQTLTALNANAVLDGGIKQVIMGGRTTGAFTAVRMNNGNVYCAGDNSNGQLGDATTTDATSFVKSLHSNPKLSKLFVSGMDAEAALLGLTTEGELFATGYNGLGQMSVAAGNTDDLPIPTLVKLK